MSKTEYASEGLSNPFLTSTNILQYPEMAAGKTAIGEIANVQRIAGISQLIFNNMVIDGKTVKMRALSSPVEDPDIKGVRTVERLLQLYSQSEVYLVVVLCFF